MARKSSGDAARARAVDHGVDPSQWRRVHWITPILNSWQLLGVLLAVLVYQNFSWIPELLSDPDVPLSFGQIILLVLGGLVVILLLGAVYSYFAWRALSFAVTDEAVWLRSGVLFRSQKHVRLERIQAVDVIHPLLGRIFGLGKLKVESAGGPGGNLEIGYLKSDSLAEVRAEIMARAAGVFTDAQVPELGAELQSLDEGTAVADSNRFAPGAADRVAADVAPAPTALTPAKAVEAPETELYAIPTGRLLASIALSGGFMIAVAALVALIAGAAVVMHFGGAEAFFGMMSGVLPVGFAMIVIIWTRFSKEFDFRAAISPDGIRVRRGLLETRAETIPPGRVHAVQISQPFLWRKRGWYRVRISQAVSQVSQDSSKLAATVLLPVGDKDQALLALWLVIPDLGTPVEARGFFDQALQGSGSTPGFIGIPRSARIFDPLVYRRRAVAMTDTCMVVRDGRIKHTASLVTYQRIQSQVCSQGPWERRLGLANVLAATVPSLFTVDIKHLAEGDAAAVRQVITDRSEVRRASEPPERWFSRVSGQTSPAGQETHE